MADAYRDQNNVPTLIASSSADGQTPIRLWADPVTHRLLVDSGGGQTFMMVTVGDSTADYNVADYADIGAAINQAYADLPTEGGGIFIQSGTYQFTTPIVFDTNNKFVSLFGANAASTFLQYTPTSGNAITMNCGNPTGHIVYELTGICLMGTTSLVAAGQVNTRTSVGIYYGGANGCAGFNTHDMTVNGFGSNWEIGQHAYMLSFSNCGNSGGNGGQAARGSLVHINVANDSGERNVFTQCNFTDPGNSDADNAIYITNAGTASNFFYMCSIDSAQITVGASNGTTTISACHFENPGAPTAYAEYIPILGVSSDSSTQINLIGNEFANSATNRTWTTIVRHGGQLYAVGNHLDNYNGFTVTNFVLHDLNNGTSSDHVAQTQVQGGALTNIIGGSGGMTHSRATGVATAMNVSNSFTIGLRPMASNTNEFFSGNTTTGTYNNPGDWTFTRDVSVGRNLSVANGSIELGNASDTTLSRSSAGVLAVEGVVIPSISSTNTLTNKRITRRLTTTNAPGATPTTNTDNVDVMNFTGLNTAITSMTTNLSGTPTDGQLLEFRFLDDGTARAITWGASFASTTVNLPTTTVISTCLRVGLEYRSASAVWECVAVA